MSNVFRKKHIKKRCKQDKFRNIFFNKEKFIIKTSVIATIVFVFFLCIYNRKNKLKIMTITSVLFSLFIECTQYFSGRYFDIDDIIWNTIGAIIGLLIYSFIQKIASKKDTIQELVTK